MKLCNRSVWILVGAWAAAATVHAQVPASNDTSDGNQNTGMGTGALGGPAPSNFGSENTAAGYAALFSDSTGMFSTAFGAYALLSNTTGSYNTATGVNALASNSTGDSNTATGFAALNDNTTGIANTASGFDALLSNRTGNDNTATGTYALNLNTTGNDNTAFGVAALQRNTTGADNTASGFQALLYNTIGYNNTASGYEALHANTTGYYNTATGSGALAANTSGSTNIGIGYHGGYSLTTGSNNIDIGNIGLAADSGSIRIGTAGTQKTAYIAGIENTHVTGAAVYVTAAGQLGVLASSERYKTGIAPMGRRSDPLQELRPVTFHLKSDPHGALQFGLIAEEVEKVYPDLVIRDSAGTIQGVRYDELAPLLLNEIQRQRRLMTVAGEQAASQARTIQAQASQLAEVRAGVSELRREMAEARQLNESLQAAVTRLQAAPERLAQR
jgi:hypothetical protein